MFIHCKILFTETIPSLCTCTEITQAPMHMNILTIQNLKPTWKWMFETMYSQKLNIKIYRKKEIKHPFWRKEHWRCCWSAESFFKNVWQCLNEPNICFNCHKKETPSWHTFGVGVGVGYQGLLEHIIINWTGVWGSWGSLWIAWQGEHKEYSRRHKQPSPSMKSF